MAQEWAKKFYKSKAWLECRASFISYRESVDGAYCEHCHHNLGYIVDHKIELTPTNITDPNIALNHENFQYLCLVCHNHKNGSPEGVVREGFKFNDEGDMVEV